VKTNVVWKWYFTKSIR